MARDTERRSLRAYVFMTEANLSVDSANNVTFHGNIKNYGQTPAYKHTSWTCLALRPASEYHPKFRTDAIADYIQYVRSTDVAYKDLVFSAESDLPPQGIRRKTANWFCDEMPYVVRPLTAQEATDIGVAKTILYAYGRITYEDAFGVKHWTRYVFHASHPDHWRDGILGDAPEGNDSN